MGLLALPCFKTNISQLYAQYRQDDKKESGIMTIERAKTRHHAELQILTFLINGPNANINGLEDLAQQMGAGVDDEGKPLDPTAHKRFKAGMGEIHSQLQRLLNQRVKRIGKGDSK